MKQDDDQDHPADAEGGSGGLHHHHHHDDNEKDGNFMPPQHEIGLRPGETNLLSTFGMDQHNNEENMYTGDSNDFGPSTSQNINAFDRQHHQHHQGSLISTNSASMVANAEDEDEDEEFEVDNSLSLYHAHQQALFWIKQEPVDEEEEGTYSVPIGAVKKRHTSARTTNDDNTPGTPRELSVYECIICKRTFRRRVALEQHQQAAYGYVAVKDDPNTHLASGRSARIAAAAAAFEGFSNTRSSNNHASSTSLRAPTLSSSTRNLSAPGTTTTTTTKHNSSQKSGPSYKCQYCPKKLRHPAGATIHRLGHEQKKGSLARCHFCQAAPYETDQQLAAHIARVHPTVHTFKPHRSGQAITPVEMGSMGGGFRTMEGRNVASAPTPTTTPKPTTDCVRNPNGRLVRGVTSTQRVVSVRPSSSPSSSSAATKSKKVVAAAQAKKKKNKEAVQAKRNKKAARDAYSAMQAKFGHITATTDCAGKKKKLCPRCSKQIGSYYFLQHMMRRHSHLRPHQCAHCSRSFVSSSELDKHQRVYTGQRPPYSCKQCPSGFTKESSLVKHCWCKHKADIRAYQKKKKSQKGQGGNEGGLEEGRGLGQVQPGRGGQFSRQQGVRQAQQQQKQRQMSNNNGGNFKNSNEGAGNEMPFQCNKCPQCFANQPLLEEHQLTHCFYISYRCKFCKVVVGDSQMLSHMKWHKGRGDGGGARKWSSSGRPNSLNAQDF